MADLATSAAMQRVNAILAEISGLRDEVFAIASQDSSANVTLAFAVGAWPFLPEHITDRPFEEVEGMRHVDFRSEDALKIIDMTETGPFVRRPRLSRLTPPKGHRIQ